MTVMVNNKKSGARTRTQERQELNVNLTIALVVGFVLTAITYGFLLPIRSSYLGILLYDRGFTQHICILLACMVVVFTVLKLVKLQREFLAINKEYIPQSTSLEDPRAQQVTKLQQNLASTKSLLAIRCSRVLAAYIHSGNRKASAELALDDSAFYMAASESSYSAPKILVWAVPLLGFIGTVLGISNAVNGFSGFLSEAADIEQIKQGIGTVTTGLAIGFDTTLLALCLSVLVMVPLVLVERLETRLLLAVDIYINDNLLPRLRDDSASLNEKAIQKAVEQALKERLPAPEALVQPAHAYAKQAVASLTQGFLAEVGKIQQTTTQLIDQINEASKIARSDRQEFLAFFEKEQTNTRDLATLIGEIRVANKQLVEEFRAGNSTLASSLKEQAEELSHQLEQAAEALNERVNSLGQCAAQVSEIANFQQGLEQTLHSLEQTAQLEHVLVGVRENLAQLKPVLDQLNRPRRITLVEQDDRRA